MSIVLAVALMGAVALVAPTAHASVPKALINEDTVTGGASSEEATIATALGFSVDVVTGADWDAMTQADFAVYQVLIAGDPFCSDIAASFSSNEATWAPVVMGTAVNTQPGNRVVVGTDPVLHSGGDTASDRSVVIHDGIDYAGAQPGRTGVYFDTTCGGNYGGQFGVAASMLNQLSAGTGTWTEDDAPPCGGSVAKIASTTAFDSLTTADLEGWGCSVHESFPTFASDWTPLAVATDTDTHPTCGTDNTVAPPAAACGEAYILIAGSGIVVTSPNISLTPPTATNPVGTSHTVTATVTAPDNSPVVGQLVTFTVTGQNAGASGTCVPVDCKTDSNGQVTFTYDDTNGAGDDTILAEFTDEGGTTQQASAAKTWSDEGGPATPTIATTLSSASISAGDSAHDSASLTGATSDAGGTVTYTVYTDSACSQNARDAGTETVTNGGVPDSNSLTFNSVGTFYWQAVYSGDAKNTGTSSKCTDEQLVVGQASPTTSTTLSSSPIASGGSAHDSASLTGATSDAGGTVTYTVYTDSACSQNARDAGTVTVTNGGVPDSNSLTFNSVGTFYWQAVYSGDTNNKGASSTCTDEQLVVMNPPSQITPTNTTCQTFSSGTASTLTQLQYSLKSGKINQVNPGVFFYWVKVTGGGTYTITENASPTFKKFAIASGSAVFNSSCTALKKASIAQNATTGTVTVTFTGSGTFYIGIKYSASSVGGQPAPSPATVHYDFSTTGVALSTQGMNLVKK